MSRQPTWTGMLMVIYRDGDDLGLLSGISLSEVPNPLAEQYYKSCSDNEMRMWQELDYLEDLKLVETERATEADEEVLKVRLTPKGVDIAHQIQFRTDREMSNKFDRMQSDAIQHSIAYFTVMLALVTAAHAAVIAFSEVGINEWLVLLMGGFPVLAILWLTIEFYKGDLIPNPHPANDY